MAVAAQRFVLKLASSFLLCCMLMGSPLAAQAVQTEKTKLDPGFLSDFVRRNYTTADGLPGMTIPKILQDRKGYIYLGTYDGLVRFDGVEFTVFSRNTDSKYDFASARSIFQDSRDNLWVGHNDEGITCFGADGSLAKWTVDDGLPNNKVNDICEDAKGNIWIGTASGLCYLTLDGTLVVPEGLAELGEENILVVHLFMDSSSRIWVTTGSADSLFVWENGRLERFAGIHSVEHPAIRVVAEARDGTLCFGIDPNIVVALKDGEEKVLYTGHPTKSETAISSILEDSQGHFWIGTDAGIAIMSSDSVVYYGKENGLPDDVVNEIVEDREGNIWICFNRGGVQKLSGGRFRTVPTGSSVNAICEDSGRGLAWLASDKGLLAYRNGTFVENDITRLCKGMRVRHVALSADGELLVSSYSDMPQICMDRDGRIRVWSVDDGIAGNKCRVAIKTSSGDYYIGTQVGLSIIHHEDGHISTMTKDDGFSNHYVMWIYEDESRRVWVGTNGGGVYILEDEKIVRSFSTADGLAGNVIFKISRMDGAIWICTGTGASRYVEETDSFVNFNSQNGLGTDSVFQIVVDHTGVAWMTTNKGVLSVPFSEIQEILDGSRDTLSVTYYGASDGMVTNGVTSVSLACADSSGDLWFPFVDGFAIYDPEKSEKNTVAPRIEIQSYTIDGETSDYMGGSITVPAGANRLSIKYTGMSFISPESIRFTSMLGGFEKDFESWSPSRSATYTNLPHGSYRFMVKARNSDGLAGEPVYVTVVKKPFLWELIWFRIVVALSVLGVLAMVLWIRFRNMKSQQLKLEKMVEDRTREQTIANEKAESLLLNILPAKVARELSDDPGRTIARTYSNATVLFTDIVGFTEMSGNMDAEMVVTILNRLVTKFDERARYEGIEKIKTIGDAYMAATGLGEYGGGGDAAKMLRFAQGLLQDVRDFNKIWKTNLQIRVGINTGRLVAGLIGKSKFTYDIWGDTVNVASRMESTGEPMRIHVSDATYEQTKDLFPYGEASIVSVKGKGEMKTYFL